VGYPGYTSRLREAAQVRQTVAWLLPRSIKRATDRIALLDKLAEADRETALRVSTRLRSLNNFLTKDKGVLQGMVAGGVLGQKEALENELAAWIDADPERKAKYGDVLPALNSLVAEAAKMRERNNLLIELFYDTDSAFDAAQTLYRFSIEKVKPDADRDKAFQARNWTQIRERLDRMQRSLDPKVGRAMLRYTLVDIARLPGDQRIDALDQAVGLKPGMSEMDAARAIDAFLDRLLAGTELYKKEVRLGMLDKSTANLVATKDSMLVLAAALYPLEEANLEKVKEWVGAYYRLRPRYAEALLAKSGGLVAPDANRTLRVTYGTVKGVQPRDGLRYLPQTTLQGIVEKATGKGDFNAPQAELQAIHALRAGKPTSYLDPKLNDVPVDFLSTVDITNGNSGSATLNSKGELVGLFFDGSFDTVASDYLFDKEKTRAIHVDSRNMLWVMTEVDKATHLLQEMGLALAQHGHGDEKGPWFKRLSAVDIDEEMSGKKSKASTVEVTFPPGAAAGRHRHPGPVFGYVLQGELEFAIGDGKVRTLKAGDTFYEPAMALLTVLRNPSDKVTTRVLAVCVHPQDAKELVIPEPTKKE